MKFKFVILIILLFLITTAGAFAVGEVTFEDLETNEPAILQGNPFYFLKSWGRGIKGIFTKDLVETILHEQENLSEKAAELKKLEELASENRNVLNKALCSYQKVLGSFTEALKDLNKDDLNSQELNQIIDQLIVHLRLSDDLSAELTRKRDQSLLLEIQDQIVDNIFWIATKIDTPKNLRVRITNLYHDEQGFLDLRTAEAIKMILERCDSFNKSSSLEIELNKLRLSLMKDFAIWFNDEIEKSGDKIIYELETVVGTIAQRIKSIEVLEKYFPKIFFVIQ